MNFSPKSIDLAKLEMRPRNPDLVAEYASVIEFLGTQPGLARTSKKKNAPAPGSPDYIRFHAASFANGRNLKAPSSPSTVPDEMVSFVLHHYFDVPKGDLKRVKDEHLLAMASENIVGTILEHYIASVAEDFDWIWCSGEMVLAVDFIKRPKSRTDDWRMLQIKNRDNSENSSSSKIRAGTKIEKWYRTKSRTGETMWDVFPDNNLRHHLSEEGFVDFAFRYLTLARLG